jgi:hypothetical protein
MNDPINKTIRQFYDFRVLILEYVSKDRLKLFVLFTILFNLLVYVWQSTQ